MKKIYLGTNTKMFQTPSEAEAFITRLKELTADISREEMMLFVIPSFTSLERAVRAGCGSIRIGAQTMGWEDRGQFTGEISPLMLEELGVRFVMIGHSERRHVLHETDEEEARRVRCAVNHRFGALLCIGETAEQKEAGLSEDTLREQIRIGAGQITAAEAREHLWVAYEPVWAIGVNGTPASAEYAERMHVVIKQTLEELFGEDGKEVPVLYGGSVNPGNATELIVQPDIDGLFIGRSAWDADRFNRIIRSVLPLFKERSAAL